MNTPTPQSTEPRAYVDARFIQQRIVSETITSAPAKPSATPQQIQIRAEVGTSFSIGVNNPTKPTEMYVEAEFRVMLKLPNSEKDLVTYLAKHVAQFKILGWTGFDEWGSIPEGALGPYFAMTYGIAQIRAEHTLLDMGLRGVALPRASTFDEYSSKKAGGIEAPSA